MCDEVGSLMMSKVRGKVEPQEEIEPGIVSPQLGGRQPHLHLPQHSKLLDNQTSWTSVSSDDAGLMAFLGNSTRARHSNGLFVDLENLAFDVTCNLREKSHWNASRAIQEEDVGSPNR